MHIEIKDLQTGEEHRIDEQGSSIGRDANRAAIAVTESGVSGLHAKITFRDGTFWVEDQKSSNGTFIDKNRMREPFALELGMTFRLHTYSFEVVNLEQMSDGGQTAVSNAETRVKASAPPPAALKKTSGPLNKPAATPEPEEEEQEEEEAPSADEAMDDPKSEPVSSPFDKSGKVAGKVGAAKDEAKGAAQSGQVAEQARQAMTYYFAAVPKLAMLPKAAIEESISNQKFPGMKPMELVAWALPALLLGQLVGVLVSLATMIRMGHFAPVAFVTSFVIGVAISIVAALVSGFIFHPILNWLVNILKGKSDEKSRSNYFVMAMTAASLSTVVAGAGGLFALIPLPFVFVVPMILSLGTTLITLYMAHQWFAYFNVVKWWLTVIKVFAVLAVLSSVWGIINSFRGPSTIGGAGAGAAASADAIAAAQKAAEQAAKAAGGNSADAQKAIADAQKAAEQAAKAAGANTANVNGADVQKAIAEAQKAAEQAAKAGNAGADGADQAAATNAAANAAVAANTAAQAQAGNTAADKAAAKAAGKAAAAANARGTPSGDYETYVHKREAVEQAIGKNPTVLTKVDGVLGLYKQLHREMDIVKGKYKKSDKDDVVSQRLKEAELFDRTAALVDTLHAKLLE